MSAGALNKVYYDNDGNITVIVCEKCRAIFMNAGEPGRAERVYNEHLGFCGAVETKKKSVVKGVAKARRVRGGTVITKGLFENYMEGGESK